MVFNEKLNFLMNITSTPNSALARYTSLDASHISRLRRGERRLAKNNNYIKKMSEYFSRHLIYDYQRKALMEMLDKPLAKSNQEEMADIINQWLTDKNIHETMVVEGFLEGISHLDVKKRPRVAAVEYQKEPDLDQGDISIHYGIEGKRDAVIAFLNLVIKSGEKDTLLLFSDEDMEWLSGDFAFSVTWSKLLSQVIMGGNKIKIIHTVSRQLDEMMEALAKWIPLYMTGTIEPYYYPKKRDGIFKRTLFVAPKTAAVISNSVGDDYSKAANILLKDARAVESVREEFNAYFMLCRPLMKIFTRGQRNEYLKMLDEFENEKADAMIKTEALSLGTMPETVMKSMLERVDDKKRDEIFRFYLKRRAYFNHNLKHNHFTEIIRMPKRSKIKESGIALDAIRMLDTEGLYYDKEAYRSHLENIVKILLGHDNYHVFIDKELKPEGYGLYVKEELGAFVVKTENPAVVFAINESNMTAAFWDYIKSKNYNFNTDKDRVIKELLLLISNID